MTDATTLALVRQRDDLVARIAIERATLAQNNDSLRRLSRMIDKLYDGIHHLKIHPEILLLPLAITAMSRPRRLIALGVSGFGLWKLLQSWRRQILS